MRGMSGTVCLSVAAGLTMFKTQHNDYPIRLPTGVDFRSQEQRDEWELKEYNRSVAERVEARTETEERK